MFLDLWGEQSEKSPLPTTTGKPTSDGPILLTSDGQAACHWYAVTGNWLLVTGKIARH
jgi:hypothetical protein